MDVFLWYKTLLRITRSINDERSIVSMNTSMPRFLIACMLVVLMPFVLNNANMHAQSIVSGVSGNDNNAKGQIIGEVFEGNESINYPAGQGTIQLLDPVSRSVKLSTNTTGGTFQFYNVPIGNYIVVISSRGYYEHPINEVFDWACF